eukprot:TRINITY_DN12182_c1_g1_i1.p1 TRINITY_DN12182_c1_g1~~TRINITY_DN12182_c1_g1_i1.p1  ORF type:complete len:775 (-),score=132.54 TRINITY_DN12182_c1_g1_i1:43-2367(-)
MRVGADATRHREEEEEALHNVGNEVGEIQTFLQGTLVEESSARISAPRSPVGVTAQQLNFRLLMSQFLEVEKAICSGQMLGLLSCELVEDNLLEWEVDLAFPPETALQQDLNALAQRSFDESQNRLTLQVRFAPEFPTVPPELWIRRPRLRYQSAPISFGGKVCSSMLTSSGWMPRCSILLIIQQVQGAVADAGARVDFDLSLRRGYPSAPPRLHRLSSFLFPEANHFVKHKMLAISANEAVPFLGDCHRLMESDKVGLPFEFAEELYGRAARGHELILPLMFEIKTQLGRKSHCTVLDFIEGLPITHILLPKWVMNGLFIAEREAVSIRCVELDLIKFVKVRPHSVDFYKVVGKSNQDVQMLMTASLSRFSALTEDTSVPIEIDGERHWVEIVEVQPVGAARIIDSDVQNHFEFRVDFDPAPDLEDEDALRKRQNELVARYIAKRDQEAATRQADEERKNQARRRLFEDFVARVKRDAGEHDGLEGDVAVAMRLPSGVRLMARFREGAPAVALVAFALASEWAQVACPCGVRIITSVPCTPVLQEHERITRVIHRSTVTIQETPAPEPSKEGAVADPLLQRIIEVFRRYDKHKSGTIDYSVLVETLGILGGRSWGASACDTVVGASGACCGPGLLNYEVLLAWLFADSVDDKAVATNLEDSGPPKHNEEAIRRCTQRAFDIQRWVQSGMTLAEAEQRVTGGELLPPISPASDNRPNTRVEESDEDADDEDAAADQIQEVMNFAGVGREVAIDALENSAWNTELAINILMDELS